MNNETREKITQIISKAMERIIHRHTVEEPFREDLVQETNPFGYRLVSPLVWKGAKFERSFVTVLGQGVFEQIAKVVAEGTGAWPKWTCNII